MKDFSEKARAYALKNALAHEGKAQPGAVISSLFHEGLEKDEVKKILKGDFRDSQRHQFPFWSRTGKRILKIREIHKRERNKRGA